LLLMIDPKPDPVRVFGESDESFLVRGGNDRIVLELARRLEDAIELDTRLEAVTARADGSFVCSLRRGETSVTAEAQHVLLAIPFTLLRDVRIDVDLPPVKRRAIAELGYGTNAKLMIGFSNRVWRTAHRSNGSVLTDLPCQLSWETSRLQPGQHGILTNFTGGRHGVEIGEGTAAEQAASFVAQLERVFPGVSGARAGMREVRAHWPSHPFTRGSYASYLVGQWTGISGAEGESVGRLHFAGEHCSLEAQGFMEGGCETGQTAAAEILRDLGVRRDASRRSLVGSALAHGWRRTGIRGASLALG
ncbi:MAG: flavin monoamine oxidase family protein, partial [Gemmatimonadaceae bacterium]